MSDGYSDEDFIPIDFPEDDEEDAPDQEKQPSLYEKGKLASDASKNLKETHLVLEEENRLLKRENLELSHENFTLRKQEMILRKDNEELRKKNKEFEFCLNLMEILNSITTLNLSVKSLRNEVSVIREHRVMQNLLDHAA